MIINANGWIGFGNDNPEWNNSFLPSSDGPNPAIFPFWDDLNPVNDNCNDYCSGNVSRNPFFLQRLQRHTHYCFGHVKLRWLSFAWERAESAEPTATRPREPQ